MRTHQPHAAARRAGLRLAALVVALTAACDRGGKATPDSANGGVAASAGALDTPVLRVNGVPYVVNDSSYALWRTASERLARLPEDRSMINPHVEHLRAIDEEDVENTIRNLESDSDARRAISSSGITVRDFVMATLALHQALEMSDSVSRPVRWENVPNANLAFVRGHRAEIERLRANHRFKVVDDDPDDPDAARRLREKVRRRQQRAGGQ
ncbi:MAG: hypothetical protein ACJ8AO_13935 [Gemmatimonadaceae bacterium]